MLSDRATRLAVWGDPIEHSRSPQMHAAAYGVLGLPWEYTRRQVPAAEFAATLAGRDDTWRGLSVTYPLKGEALAAADVIDERAARTRAVNTVLFDGGTVRGFNTDIGGIVAALREAGLGDVARARIVGAGATATSAVVALAELGADVVDVVARRPGAVAPLTALGQELGVTVRAMSFDTALAPADVTIATLPGGAEVADAAADALADGGGILLDVVYGHWPTDLARAWERAGGTALSGLGMLLHQAVLQVRIFVSSEVDQPVDDEAAVVDAMRRALVGD